MKENYLEHSNEHSVMKNLSNAALIMKYVYMNYMN